MYFTARTVCSNSVLTVYWPSPPRIHPGSGMAFTNSHASMQKKASRRALRLKDFFYFTKLEMPLFMAGFTNKEGVLALNELN